DPLEIATSEPAVGNINQDDATVRVRASLDFGDETCHRLRPPEKILMEGWKLAKARETTGGKFWKKRFWHLALAGLDDPLRDQATRGLDIDAGCSGARATGLAETQRQEEIILGRQAD